MKESARSMSSSGVSANVLLQRASNQSEVKVAEPLRGEMQGAYKMSVVEYFVETRVEYDKDFSLGG